MIDVRHVPTGANLTCASESRIRSAQNSNEAAFGAVGSAIWTQSGPWPNLKQLGVQRLPIPATRWLGKRRDGGGIVSGSVFHEGATMIVLFASAIYHSWTSSQIHHVHHKAFTGGPKEVVEPRTFPVV